MSDVGFVENTQFVLPAGGCGPMSILNDVTCVRLSFSNGGSIICGKDQLILLNDGWRKAIDCCSGKVNGIRIDNVEVCGVYDTYCVESYNEAHSYGVFVNGCVIVVHNLSIGYLLGYQGKLFKYMPYEAERIVTVTKKHTTTENVVPVVANFMIMLGGPFEDIGNTNEAIGGENQKVG